MAATVQPPLVAVAPVAAGAAALLKRRKRPRHLLFERKHCDVQMLEAAQLVETVSSAMELPVVAGKTVALVAALAVFEAGAAQP